MSAVLIVLPFVILPFTPSLAFCLWIGVPWLRARRRIALRLKWQE